MQKFGYKLCAEMTLFCFVDISQEGNQNQLRANILLRRLLSKVFYTKMCPNCKFLAPNAKKWV